MFRRPVELLNELRISGKSFRQSESCIGHGQAKLKVILVFGHLLGKKTLEFREKMLIGQCTWSSRSWVSRLIVETGNDPEKMSWR